MGKNLKQCETPRLGKPAPTQAYRKLTDEKGHPVWSLTFMVGGKKRVERIPPEWVEEVQHRVEAGREFKEAVAEVFAANAQLWALWRKQQGR